jgi:hypothetical protein
MQVPRKFQSRNWMIGAMLTVFAAAALGGFQFGDRHGMNSMPYAQVAPLVADVGKARRMAAEGNIELLAGQAVPGKDVSLRGELTDANCFLSKHEHAYDHAFCAKLCAAAGSPLVFIPDEGGPLYVVLTQPNATRIPNAILDQMGVPGIVVKGKVVESNGVAGLALDSTTP